MAYYQPDPDQEYICCPTLKSAGFTFLMVMVIKVHLDPEMMRLIQEFSRLHPEEINRQNAEGWSALHLAARNARTHDYNKMVEILINAGANINMTTRKKETALMMAAQNNYDDCGEITKMLIDAGADVNSIDEQEKNALIYAAIRSRSHDSANIARMLIEKGANVNHSDKDGRTALIYAASTNNSLDTITALLNAGAHVDMWDDNQRTALLEAILNAPSHNSARIVEILTHAGANPNIRLSGKTAFETARDHEPDSRVAEMLDVWAFCNNTRTFQPDPDMEYKCWGDVVSTGFTPLMMMVMAALDDPSLVAFIQERVRQHPEELNCRNDLGHTALQLAGINRNRQIINILMEAHVYAEKINWLAIFQGLYGVWFGRQIVKN